MYVIQNIRTKKFVFGTDYRYRPPHQRTSTERMLTYATGWMAVSDFRHRECGNDYRIVTLKPIEVDTITDLHSKTFEEVLDAQI